MSMLTMFRGKKDTVSTAPAGAVPAELVPIIGRQCPSWTASALSSCSLNQKKGSYKDCKAEVEVLDSTGKLVVRGREFHSGEWLFWIP